MNTKPSDKRSHLPGRQRITFWPRRLQRPLVETIVVDTDSIVDFTNPTISAYPFECTDENLLISAARAITETTRSMLIPLKDALPSVAAKHVTIYSSSIVGNTRHHGEWYLTDWLGNPEEVIQRCELTDSERENLLARARKLSAEGNIVYCVAENRTVQTKTLDPRHIKPQALTCLGLISQRIHLHPDIKKSLEICKQQGITILYASRDCEQTVTAVAHHAQLLGGAEIAFRYTHGVPLPKGHTAYANLNDRVHKELISSLASDTTIVADQPLPHIVRTITVR